MDRAGPRRSGRVTERRAARTASQPRTGQRTRRRADGDRPEPDPVRPLPVARPRADPRRRPGCPARDGLGRGPRRRPARRRRGDAARLAELGRVRPPAGPRPAPGLGPFGDLGGRARADAGVPRARPGRDQRPRRVQPADRRVRADDDPGRQPAAAPAPRAPARADVAAARGRRAARRDRRDRRPGLDRAGGRPLWRRALAVGSSPSAATPSSTRRRASVEDEVRGGRRAAARSRRRSGDAPRAARRIRFHRPGRAADARDGGHDQRRDARHGQARAPG